MPTSYIFAAPENGYTLIPTSSSRISILLNTVRAALGTTTGTSAAARKVPFQLALSPPPVHPAIVNLLSFWLAGAKLGR